MMTKHQTKIRQMFAAIHRRIEYTSATTIGTGHLPVLAKLYGQKNNLGTHNGADSECWLAILRHIMPFS